ncbi:MAG: M56 family metallopeptidase [Acidobacteria bacterium]|nr:M56 family metallopeptidase [Acidobacteriota bacterium]
MNVWGEMLLSYVLNAWWLGALLAALAWLTAQWLRRAGAAVTCWIWRIAILATALLPLCSTGLVVTGQGAVAIADGSEGRAAWMWTVVAGYAAIRVAWQLAGLLSGWRGVIRLQRQGARREFAPWAWRTMVECSARFAGPPATIIAGTSGAAYTAGWPRPVLVLPERYFGPEEVPGLASVAGHELAHIERADYAWNLLLEAISAAVAFHPAVSWMKWHAALERERACDELVVKRLRPAVEYAGDLLGFAREAIGTAVPRHAMTVLDGNTLEARVRSVLSPVNAVTTQAALTRSMAAVFIVIALSAALPWRALYVDFAPRPAPVNRMGGRWTWAPPPPPPPPPPRFVLRGPPPPPPAEAH